MVLYEGGVSKKQLIFDASGTDKLNWFSVGKLNSSSWTDIKNEPRNFFSIEGDCGSGQDCRSFFINREHAGCENDAGWLMTAGVLCAYEKGPKAKSVLYSKLATYTNWNTDSKDSQSLAF